MSLPFLVLAALLSTPAQEAPNLAKHVYPLSKPVACPEVVIDTTDFPEGEKWMQAAKGIVETWYSKVCELLATDGRDPLTGETEGKPLQHPKLIKLVVKKDLRAPAYASGGTITINGSWITKHRDDLGMVVHELTHVVQHYPDNEKDTGWLVEGIADYVRWWRYEPELHATKGRTKVDPAKAKYTDSYRTTAVWLAWCSRKYHMALVPCLDKALREGRDPMPVFSKLTGKSADELWGEFILDWK